MTGADTVAGAAHIDGLAWSQDDREIANDSQFPEPVTPVTPQDRAGWDETFICAGLITLGAAAVVAVVAGVGDAVAGVTRSG